MVIEAVIISQDTVTIAPVRVRTVGHGPVMVHRISVTRLSSISNSAIIIIIIIRREIIIRTRSRDIRAKEIIPRLEEMVEEVTETDGDDRCRHQNVRKCRLTSSHVIICNS